MFFCSVCCPKVSLALKLEDKSSFLTLECENIHKAISDLSAKLNRKSLFIRKRIGRTIKETTTTLSTIQPYNIVSDSSRSMAVDIVKELEDKERRKNNLIFNVPEPTTPSWKADSAYISDLCRTAFNLNIEIIKLFRLGKKIDQKHRPLLICLSNHEIKAIILSKSFIFCQTSPYEDIFVSTDMTKAEQARRKLLVEQLKSRKAREETDIIIRGDSIVTRSKSRQQQTVEQKPRSSSPESQSH